ncbi:UNVERIFIED_CONTAM: hypothetical protein GTU68_062882 [Idotea baltica]|nr:hypothetical protein [Idotea baltica]
MVINQPFSVANVAGQFDVMCTVKGGGLSGQAGAVKHGISKALSLYDPLVRPALKKAGFLTRDSRVVNVRNTVRRKPVVASSSRNANSVSNCTLGRRFGRPFSFKLRAS